MMSATNTAPVFEGMRLIEPWMGGHIDTHTHTDTLKSCSDILIVSN